MCTRIAVRCPVMLVCFALFMAMKINSRMALVFLAVLPILAIGMGILMKVVGPVFERAFKIYDRMNTVVQENVRGIRVVKTYVREDHETEKFEGVSGMLYRTFSKAQKTMAGVMPLMQFCMYACMLLIFVVRRASDRRRLDDHRRVDQHVLLRDADPDEPDDGSDGFVMITMAKASAERVAEILDEQPDLHNPRTRFTRSKDGAIEFDDVSFSYKGAMSASWRSKRQPAYQRPVRPSAFSAAPVPRKSTLVQLIPRLYDTTHGTVKVGGVDVRDYDIEALRDQVAMVLRRTCCSPARSRKTFAGVTKMPRTRELERVCRLAQADEFIQQMPDKYDTHIEQGGSNVSGGQKQRLCIARALLKKAEDPHS